jgi:hypothetical protein
METAGQLHALADTGTATARYESGAYRTARAHLARLLGEVGRHDAAYCADVLLAPVSASLLVHQRRDLGYSTARIKAGLDGLLDALLASSGCPGR